MCKLLEKHNLPKFIKKELENMKNPVSVEEIESKIKNISTKKTTGQYNITSKLYQTFIKKYLLLIRD